MGILASTGLFTWGILKKWYFWIVPLLLDPFELYNNHIRFWMPRDRQGEVALPTEWSLPLFCVMLVIAAIATYHELRKSIPQKPSIKVSARSELQSDNTVQAGTNFELDVENITGPIAEFFGEISVEFTLEFPPYRALQPESQNRALASRDTAGNRIPISKGQRGVFRLCRSARADGIQHLDVAVGTAQGFEWIEQPGHLKEGVLASDFKLMVVVHSEPDHKSQKAYTFLIKPLPPTVFLQLEDITPYHSSGKLSVLKRFRRNKSLHEPAR
jgi:hypothetical protein